MLITPSQPKLMVRRGGKQSRVKIVSPIKAPDHKNPQQECTAPSRTKPHMLPALMPSVTRLPPFAYIDSLRFIDLGYR